MLTFKQFCFIYPDLARFNDIYTRRSSLGRIYFVRKNRWGNSKARMFDRRSKIKRSLNILVNTGRVSENANSNLLNLNLKNISNRGQRRAYALVVKKAARGLGRVI
jgi:hypothetical protein